MIDPSLARALDALASGALEAARDLLRPLAEAGYGEAAYWLSRSLMHDTPARLNWLHRAAELGSGQAHLELAGLYEEGRIVRRDPEAARAAYLAAAQTGQAEAQFVLGSLLASGGLFETDPDGSAHWTRAAAEQGHQGAMLNLAHKLLQAGARGEAAQWGHRAALSEEPDIAAWAGDVLAALEAGGSGTGSP
ncbi:sel1 repeat family protein [Alkalicaulis satelles]|uniref:Sel1 repeat family protein n=1 Tax=Alkalicaulis satelles TaxID=2609175 RepID=A0A5M6ZIQ4_9PROT|nr:sel1 repeat family protein [Alkalicaulis satelles]KAA5803644.1 sel1 repeat family protein [Alkalicaulis satelles]